MCLSGRTLQMQVKLLPESTLLNENACIRDRAPLCELLVKDSLEDPQIIRQLPLLSVAQQNQMVGPTAEDASLSGYEKKKKSTWTLAGSFSPTDLFSQCQQVLCRLLRQNYHAVFLSTTFACYSIKWTGRYNCTKYILQRKSNIF